VKNKGDLGETEPKGQLLHSLLGGPLAAPSAKLCLALPHPYSQVNARARVYTDGMSDG